MGIDGPDESVETFQERVVETLSWQCFRLPVLLSTAAKLRTGRPSVAASLHAMYQHNYGYNDRLSELQLCAYYYLHPLLSRIHTVFTVLQEPFLSVRTLPNRCWNLILLNGKSPNSWFISFTPRLKQGHSELVCRGHLEITHSPSPMWKWCL